ncbi:DUF1761 domain-containing protein [Portibacter marinus]|uniref:DUF1761 domain-containing protein n=1 Tax=Portibacter marinus TaxID=2898660 RepID=UPI001F402388|nr:DUF1761 domain-containing protein [Portibacter marinus]
MDPSTINWWAILVAGISAFVLGGVWYSPALFGKAWMKENKLTEEDIKGGNASKIYGWAFVISLIMSANLGMFLGDSPEACIGECAQRTDVTWGTIAGFLAGIWAFAAIAIVALFEQKSAKYIFINGGYVLIALMLMGAIIGIWR